MRAKFSAPQEYIITSTQDVNLFLAGVGSGKTHIIGFLSGYYITAFPRLRGFIGANTYMQLSQSTLFRVREVWRDLFKWVEGRDYVANKMPPASFNTAGHNFGSYKGIICFRNGAVVFTGSLENASAHDGKEFGYAFLDETKDSREEDVKEVILTRLRQKGMYIDKSGKVTAEQTDLDTLNENKAFNPIYITTSPSRTTWLNEWFGLDEMQDKIGDSIFSKTDFFKFEGGGKCVSISSTYHNESNLPAGYIAKQIREQGEEKARMLIYGNPFVRAGGEFYNGFSRLKHVKPCAYDPELPLHLALDQNTVPYITATIYQVHPAENGGAVIKQIDEICLTNPRNKTSHLCLEFERRYLDCRRLYYYGDPAGRKSDTRGEHDYKIVERVLRKFLNNSSCRVPFAHPRVLKRRDFANDIFEAKDGITYEVDPRCVHSIRDFENVKEDINGKKDKKKVKDPNTGVTYEPYGHTSDSFDYFITEAFKKLFVKKYK